MNTSALVMSLVGQTLFVGFVIGPKRNPFIWYALHFDLLAIMFALLK